MENTIVVFGWREEGCGDNRHRTWDVYLTNSTDLAQTYRDGITQFVLYASELVPTGMTVDEVAARLKGCSDRAAEMVEKGMEHYRDILSYIGMATEMMNRGFKFYKTLKDSDGTALEAFENGMKYGSEAVARIFTLDVNPFPEIGEPELQPGRKF